MALRGGVRRDRIWSGKENTISFCDVNGTKCVYLRDKKESVYVSEAARQCKPRVLVITLGVSNGAGFMPDDAFIKEYRKLITDILSASPDTSVYVQSILPLSDKSVKHYKKLTKEAVLHANVLIEKLCAELGIPYIDTHGLLTDETGYLKKEYQNDEYMHLTSGAYRVIKENITAHIPGVSS